MDAAMRADIYRWAYRLLQNHHDALDATQDVLLKWLRRPDDRVENRRAWLRSTTVHHCIDVLRRRRPQPSGSLEGPPTDGPGTLARRELHDRVTAALEMLSPRQRDVLVAKVYDRETFASIAAALGISESAAKTHYVRALDGLRNALKDWNEE
jgi:RNA polymerase sigma-70 factor (ECF subfamily)